MRFRSGRLWSATGFFRAAAFFAGAACAFTVLSASSAFALTVSVVGGPNNGVTAPATINYPIIMSSCGVGNSSCTTPTPYTGSPTIPSAQILDNGNITYPVPSQDVIVFNVATTQTSFSGVPPGEGFVAVTMAGTYGSYTSVPLPIVQYQGGTCPQNGSTGQTTCWDGIQPSTTSWGGNYLYRAVSINPNTNVTIGLNVRAMVDGYLYAANSSYQTSQYNNQIFEPSSANAALPPTSPTAYSFNLTFGIYVAANGYTSGGYLGQSPVDSTTLTLNVANSGPQASTNPLNCGLGSVFPGDGSLTFDGSQFSLSTTPLSNDSLSQVWLLAKENPSGISGSPPYTLNPPLAANACAAYSSGTEAGSASSPGTWSPTTGTCSGGADPVGSPYDIVTPLPASPGNVVSGFTNSVPGGTPVNYAVGFVGSDSFGFFVQNTTTTTTCALPDAFETAAVLGFLNQSKCFIATATFRSMDSPPLVLLRAFRDRFLEHFPLGRAFVHWYYDWSPRAADWLVANPVFRFPVFLALIPLQVVAWLILHSLVLAALFIMGLSLMAYALVARLSASDREEELSG